MKINLEPIGFVRIDIEKIPRHWTVSDAEGRIVIDEQYRAGLKDIKSGERIVVLFYFHQSPRFTPDLLVQKPGHRNEQMGVFSICSPVRPILSACRLWKCSGSRFASSILKGLT